MLPWVHLGTAIVPGGGGELRLMQRGTEFVIMAGRIPRMNSRMSGAEEALATLSWERIASRKTPTMLIGGLGMGFTLRKALAVASPDARITVAELLPDADNVPDGLSRPGNDRLYSPTGLAAARAALRPNGVLAVGASEPDASFTKRLGGAGFRVEEKTVRERSNGKGARHTIWLASR